MIYLINSASLISTALQHYLGTKQLNFRHENNSAAVVLIKEIRMVASILLGPIYMCSLQRHAVVTLKVQVKNMTFIYVHM